MVEMKGHHQAIIPLELFQMTQKERENRSNIVINDDGTTRRKNTKYSSKHK